MPWVFWRLTPAEFLLLLEAHNKKVIREENREAKWVTLLANVTGRLKHKLRIEEFLGRPLDPYAPPPKRRSRG